MRKIFVILVLLLLLIIPIAVFAEDINNTTNQTAELNNSINDFFENPWIMLIISWVLLILAFGIWRYFAFLSILTGFIAASQVTLDNSIDQYLILVFWLSWIFSILVIFYGRRR